jgi:SAM-dependent methyltransferase
MQLDNVIDKMEELLAKLKREQVKTDIIQQALGFFDSRVDMGWTATEGAYHYIPVDLHDFAAALVEIDDFLQADPAYKHKRLRYRPIRFLEVGCGIGRNLFIVKHSGALELESVTGIDIAPHYIAQAKRFFFLSDQEALIADAMTFDYTPFDIVYFYRPFSDEALEARFERQLIKQLRPGAYIVGHLNSVLSKSRALIAKDNLYRVWQKKPAR